MIEREINLLAPRIIRLRTYRIYLDRVGHLIRFLLFLGGLLLAVLGGSYVVIRWTAASLTAQEGAGEDHTKATVAEAQRINAQLAGIKLWRDQHRPWTPHLPDVFEVMPVGVILTDVSVDADTQELTLRGTFPRREALVAFQRQLEALSWVATVKSPLSNFETGNDGQFTLHIARRAAL